MKKCENQSATPKMDESALRFAVTLNLWLPITGQRCFSTIEDMLLFILLPFLLLVFLYYLLAIRVNCFCQLGNLKLKNVLLLFTSQLIASIVICLFPHPIILLIIEGTLLSSLYLYSTTHQNIK